jgi:hypothetical protein
MMAAMTRRGLAWLLALPLMTVGSLAAHELAYRLVEPRTGERADLLGGTGHAYLEAAPFLLGTAGAFLVAGLLALARNAWRGGRAHVPAAWPVALLPVLGFAVQEHAERVGSDVSWLTAATEPTFAVGLALQLPFALLALLAARWLGRAAEAAGRALQAPPVRRARAHLEAPRPGTAFLLTTSPAFSPARGRAPPPGR